MNYQSRIVRLNICMAASGSEAAGAAPAVARPSDDAIADMFQRWHKANPEPKSDLKYTNNYTLLVAVVLSAQATDVGVNRATGPLFETVDTPAKMIALGEEGLREAIRTIGLYKTKAANVISLSKTLIESHGGEVPNDREALEALAGVGRKTANVVLNVAFGQPTMAVDTHVLRVAKRLGLSQGKNALQAERDLISLTPAEFGRHAHHWLILHGRYVCTARKPKCPECAIRDLCPSAGLLG